jgi:hypothetical protein
MEMETKYNKVSLNLLHSSYEVTLDCEYTPIWACTQDDDCSELSWSEFDNNTTHLDCNCGCSIHNTKSNSITVTLDIPSDIYLNSYGIIMSDIRPDVANLIKNTIIQNWVSSKGDNYPVKCKTCSHEIILANANLIYVGLSER